MPTFKGTVRQDFESARELESLMAVQLGEHVAISYQAPSGIHKQLFLKVDDAQMLSASYGPAGFPMDKASGITAEDVMSFIEAQARV